MEITEADRLPTFTDDLEFDQHAINAAKVVRCLLKHPRERPDADHVQYVADALIAQGGDAATARLIVVRGDEIGGNTSLLIMDRA